MKNIKRNPKKQLYIIVIILVVTSLVFRLLNQWRLEQTSLLFIGVPALITLLVIKYANKPKTAYATMFYVVTLFLLLCGILFGEGLICLIIMSPLFYGIGALIVAITNSLNKRNKKNLKAYILLPILLLVSQFHEINKTPQTLTISTKILVDKHTELSKMNYSPDFQKKLPSFFKIGFPKPIGIVGKGIEIGDTRTIKFLSNTKGIGELKLKIKEAKPSKLVFNIISDKTHIAHWLSYKEVSVELNQKDNKTEITWTTNFTCDLGPSWYFKPLEKTAIKLMNEHLVRSYFLE